MSESTDLDLAEVFPTEQEKRIFLRLVSSRHADASEEVDAMIENNDSDTFIEYLQLAGQPIYEAGWGALYHGASARFELYHFNGSFFATLVGDSGNAKAGPFKTAVQAAEWRGEAFDMDYLEEYGAVGAVHFTARVFNAGEKLVTRRLADKLLEVLTGIAGVGGDYYWCEAKPGKIFQDSFRDDAGRALLDLHKAQKEGVLEAISAAELKWKAQAKDDRVDVYVMGDEAKHFTSSFDSFLMKVPLDAKGKLSRFRAHWIRVCLPRRVGKKTIATVIRIKKPEQAEHGVRPLLELG
jgi:hypothetical protein